jgi:alpha-D-ribose 1-methylphosphonate 5-triphosphate synthase subunit PhnH
MQPNTDNRALIEHLSADVADTVLYTLFDEQGRVVEQIHQDDYKVSPQWLEIFAGAGVTAEEAAAAFVRLANGGEHD